MPENSTHKCTNAVNNVQPIRNSSHMAKKISVYNRLQAGDYENGNGGKRRVSRLIQFIHATLQLSMIGVEVSPCLWSLVVHCLVCNSNIKILLSQTKHWMTSDQSETTAEPVNLSVSIIIVIGTELLLVCFLRLTVTILP